MELLRLNHSDAISLRGLLMQEGVYPQKIVDS